MQTFKTCVCAERREERKKEGLVNGVFREACVGTEREEAREYSEAQRKTGVNREWVKTVMWS